MVVAIDGYSSTGKSTFAKLLASKYGLLYLDSGAMYRAITLYAIENQIIEFQPESGGSPYEQGPEGKGQPYVNEAALKTALDTLDINFKFQRGGSRTFIGSRCVEDEIRSMEVSSFVSLVSALPFVRDYVDERLKAFGKDGGIVMDGRDIGTTVFPRADIKIFMTAEASVRAKRRYDEMLSKGQEADYEEVLKNVEERDYIDSHRESSPLRKADDAIVLDNSAMTLEDQLLWFEELPKVRG